MVVEGRTKRGVLGDIAIDDFSFLPNKCEELPRGKTRKVKQINIINKYIVLLNSVKPLTHIINSGFFRNQREKTIIQLIFLDVLFQCAFETRDDESTFCNMEQQSDDGFDFSLRTGKTPSKHTGPMQAVDGGFYTHIEASKPRRVNDKAM